MADTRTSKFRSLKSIVEELDGEVNNPDRHHDLTSSRLHRSYSTFIKPDQKFRRLRTRSLSKQAPRKPSGSSGNWTLRSRKKDKSHNGKKSNESLNLDDAITLEKTAIPNGHQPNRISLPIPSMGKFNESIYWLVHKRRQFGFRHLCMLLLVLMYTLLGGAIFFSIESRYEHKRVAARKKSLGHEIKLIAEQLVRLRNENKFVNNSRWAEEFVEFVYISLLKNESLHSVSTYYNSLHPGNDKWTYASAVFFSMNLYTATGYGSLAPESMLGQFCAIWYSLLTIPVTLVVVRDLGQWLLVHLTKIYVHTLVCYRRTMGYIEPHEDTMISLPIKFCISLLAGYLLISTVFVYLLDEWCGDAPHTGISFFIAFYFSYISLTTIGLGDVMPNNATFHPAISTLFFFGLPVMKVVNRVTYIFIENGIFGTFTLLDNTLDQLTTKIQPVKEEPTIQRPTQKFSRCSVCSNILEYHDENEATEMLNGLTIRSLATFARANADVYGGGFGRVNLRKGDLVQSKTSVNNNQASP
ncbi:hypothetical protein KIN20_010481 [Parelaphostrongylus tenuis]|uniref:Potassium channel domain-containing protein n=1 Tax=Parelaphostrongylus tenuis TaxID=148309 RepID=A0AAD5M7Y0_PARTN|nr:hypothetical protein KIN20_010481 [Parelaphostrongylus tenuis]